MAVREGLGQERVTFRDEKYTLEKTELRPLGVNTVILSLPGGDVTDQTVKIALILEVAGVPLWSHCNALEGLDMQEGKYFTVRTTSHWNNLPIEVIESPVLDIAKF